MRRTRVTSEKEAGYSISSQGGGRARASCTCPAAPLLTLGFPEPGIKFAAVFFSFGTVACPSGTWLAPDTMVVRTSPTIGQLAWVQQLERPYSFHVENSDCCIVVSQHSDRPHILDKESSSLQGRVLDAYLALTLMCGPTGSQVLCITGGNDGGVVHVPQYFRWDDYLPAHGLQLAGWTPESMRNASSFYTALGNLKGHRRFNRGVNCLLEALHTRDLCHRLHSHVRAIEALIPLEDHRGRWTFAERLCDLAAYPTWGEKSTARTPPHPHVRPYLVGGQMQKIVLRDDAGKDFRCTIFSPDETFVGDIVEAVMKNYSEKFKEYQFTVKTVTPGPRGIPNTPKEPKVSVEGGNGGVVHEISRGKSENRTAVDA